MQVPQGATVVCLLLETPSPELEGIDSSAFHDWSWEPNYQEIDLKNCG